MRKAIVIIFIAILIYLVFFTDPICSAVRNREFQSIEEKSAAAILPTDTEPGVYYKYHLMITFGFIQYAQQESDFIIHGYYVCKLGKIVAHSSFGGPIFGDYNPSSGILVWDGEPYQLRD